MKEYDVIVVGAGPAGSAAARAAAQQGVSVIMIEEHAVIGAPRHCPCRLRSSRFTQEILKDLDPRGFSGKIQPKFIDNQPEKLYSFKQI